MADEKSYGWAGKMLRVNLTTGSITTEPTEPYKDYIGGMGLANKIMFDEVPAGTDPLSPENKIIFAVGPLTATGVPLAGRTTICSLSTFTKDHLVVDAHCGGMIGARIKQAGYDAIIVEGASDKPVYLNIVNDKVGPAPAWPRSGRPARTSCPTPASSTRATTPPAPAQARSWGPRSSKRSWWRATAPST